jgi:hypothetical protein
LMPARHESLQDSLPRQIWIGGSGRRKRVSARHQVKRLDRILVKGSLFRKTGPAEETSFLRSVRIFKLRNFTGGLNASSEIWS